MMSEAELLFQLGAIMLLAFMAATIARRVNQSVMIGYIIIGVLIGPYISFRIFGIEYNGLIGDTGFVDLLSQIGLIMLMFFVGLEFSFSKLKKTRTPAIILAIIDTSVGLFVGFMFASVLGWPLIDSIFLAGVIAMSSTSISMKILFDLKRMSSPEVEFLIGLVVVETFIAMMILTVASGMIVDPGTSAVNYGQLLLGMAAFYGFFVWLAMWAVPRIVKFFDKIENDELFILFALGVVFLTAGVAAVMGVPPIIGAFFIGMILAESRVTSRVQSKLESFKDAFVAIFFISFGMMIDPAMFGSVVWIVLAAISVVVVYEAFVMSSVSYFLGFSSRASATIGTSLCGRGVESILYASVGSRVKGATMAAQLNAFAGAFCFGISAVAPVLVRYSAALATKALKVSPRPLRFSGAVMSRTLGKVVMPSNLRIFKGAKTTGLVLASFVGVCFTILVTDHVIHLVLSAVGLVLAFGVLLVTRAEMSEVVRHVNYSNLGVARQDKHPIVDLISGIVFGAALSVLVIVATWSYVWQISIFVVAGFAILVIFLMVWTHRTLYSEWTLAPPRVYSIQRPGPESIEEPSDGIQKPVYSSLKASPKDIHL